MPQPVPSASPSRFLLKWRRRFVIGLVTVIGGTVLKMVIEHYFDPSVLDGPVGSLVVAAQVFGSWWLSPVAVPRWLALLVPITLLGAFGWLVFQLLAARRSLRQVQAQVAESQNPPILSLNEDQLTVLKTICDFEEISVRADYFTLPGTTHLSLLRVKVALDVLEQHKLIWNISGRFELTKGGRAYLMQPAVQCEHAV